MTGIRKAGQALGSQPDVVVPPFIYGLFQEQTDMGIQPGKLYPPFHAWLMQCLTNPGEPG